MIVLAWIVCLGISSDAIAQAWLPSEPLSIAGGTVVVGAEAVATIGPDDGGFFNYTSYEYNALRNVRFGVSAEVKVSARVRFLGEVRVEHGTEIEPYALFVRIRPWPERRFDAQVGRIPPTFGAFTRTAYAYDNFLIGQPLAYQYLLSFHTDAIPATADDLLRMRGRGWLSAFPVGNRTPGPGVPIVDTAQWDTGVQVHGAAGIFEWTGAVTTGSLSDPRVGDNNRGRQLAGRVVARPTPGWRLGVSAARAAWLDESIDTALPSGTSSANDGVQHALAGDAEYSTGRLVLRGELLRGAWSLPAVSFPAIRQPLETWGYIAEGRYRFWPGLYVASRFEALRFDLLQGTTRTATWEGNVRRVEAGLGWTVIRNVLAKGSWQKNLRDGGAVRHNTLVSGQVVYWF